MRDYFGSEISLNRRYLSRDLKDEKELPLGAEGKAINQSRPQEQYSTKIWRQERRNVVKDIGVESRRRCFEGFNVKWHLTYFCEHFCRVKEEKEWKLGDYSVMRVGSTKVVLVMKRSGWIWYLFYHNWQDLVMVRWGEGRNQVAFGFEQAVQWWFCLWMWGRLGKVFFWEVWNWKLRLDLFMCLRPFRHSGRDVK